ncbi:MAG: imidazole glycerol phosphate synthase subunit HisH [Tannerella sp.]|jgi:glutamine amidotransferase|nr:imidazole glycerol phosphate synthase subunit HisH [Tannerella sp.]
MKAVIIKYNAGNIRSVDYGLKRLGITPVITDEPEIIRAADRVVFPGQGEARTTMNYLREHHLDRLICELKQPVLGICIGMQLMCSHSDEGGDTDCLGIFDAVVKRFIPQRHEDKVPHMGWNLLTDMRGGLFRGLPENPYVYFVHSYYVSVTEDTAATGNYIHPFSAAMQKDNFYATQFHPEKSGDTGEVILRNFINVEYR